MTDDEAFLAAVRADPADPARRLVYADWLDDRGDPRGQLVRVEEAMRPLPVFSDDFWELKARRNGLRRHASPEWLAAMGYDVCRPVFAHGWPDDWRGRWRLIREFTERWYGYPMPDVGGRQDEVRAAEARLGRALAACGREWVAFAHDVRRQDDFHDVLRDTYQMLDLAGHDAVSLLLQGEGDYHWAVLNDDLARPDPPVHGFHHDWSLDDDVDIDENEFVPAAENPVADSVTTFALRNAMSFATGAAGFGAEVDRASEFLRELNAAFPSRCRVLGLDLFEADDVRVTALPSDDLTRLRVDVFVARRAALEAIPEFLWDVRLQIERTGGYLSNLARTGGTPADEVRGAEPPAELPAVQAGPPDEGGPPGAGEEIPF